MTPRNNLDDSLCWTDIYYTQSNDLGITWSTPINLTAANTIQRTSIPQVSKRFDVSRNRTYLLYAIARSPSDDMDLIWAYDNFNAVPTYILLTGANTTRIVENENIGIQGSFLRISPNPVTNHMIIDYTMNSQIFRKANMNIYDIYGRCIRSFVNDCGSRKATVKWDCKDAKGHMLPAGIYFLQLDTGTYSEVVKFIIIR